MAAGLNRQAHKHAGNDCRQHTDNQVDKRAVATEWYEFVSLRSRLVKDRADEMPSSRPLIAPVLAVPAPTLLFKNSRDAEDCLRGGMRLDLGEL